eukprot:405384-Hanusia_phi.AAC.1
MHTGEDAGEPHHDLLRAALRTGGGARSGVAVIRAGEARLIHRIGVGTRRAVGAGTGDRRGAGRPSPLLPRAADRSSRTAGIRAGHTRGRPLGALVGTGTAGMAESRVGRILVEAPGTVQAHAPLHVLRGVLARYALRAGRHGAARAAAPRGAGHPVIA